MSESNEIQDLRRRLAQEKQDREEAERLLESKSRQLYEANRQLTRLNYSLEQRVRERTAELREALDQTDQFRQIFDLSVDLSCIMDSEHTLRVVNNSWEKLLGIDSTELTGRRLETLVTPETREETTSVLDALMTDEEPAQGCEFQFRNPAGQLRFYSFNLVPDEDRLHIYGAGRDITEQRRFSRLLQESERRHRDLVMSLKEVIFKTDTNGCWTFLNDAWEEVTGFLVEESLGELFLMYVHPEDRESNQKHFQPLLEREKTSCRHEARYITRDGGFRWIEVNARLMTDKDDRPTGTFGTLMDITERKLAEESLLEKNQQLRDFFEHSPAAVAMTDDQMCYLFASSRWIEDYRLGEQDIIGKNHYEVFPEVPERWKKIHKRVLKTGTVERADEERFDRADGRVDWVRWEVRPWRRIDGEIGGLWMFTEIITHRKEAEMELIEARDRAESANRAKSEFLANMSHEIRTPMNAILGFSELMEKSVEEPRHKRYLNSIISSGQTLMQLINDLLDLSKIEAGKMNLELEPVSMRVLVREVVDMFSAKAKEKGLKFESHIDPEIPEALLLDEVRVRQVLLNLLGNAIKFTDEGGVSIRVSQEKLVEDGSQVELAMEVRDTGIGISETDQERIFEAFEQQSGQATRKYGGTGLGLAITRRLVEMMGGRVTLQSSPGEGSVFRVNFRRIDVASFQGRQGEEETLPEQILFTGGTVLVVDDIVTNREVITEFLQGMNLQLLQAGNGREALQVVGRHRPDLILLDIQMPVMDGWEFARIIKEDPDTREIPVVVLSATVAMNYRERLRELGLQGFLGKPIRRMRLVEEIKRFLPWRLLNEYLREAMDDEQDTEETLSNNVPDHPPETNPAQPLDQRKARELMELLRGRLRREREEIQETSEMSRIEAFAGEMRRLASEHGLQSLAKYAEDLNSAVDSFDISGITHLLEQYPALLDNLEEELPG